MATKLENARRQQQIAQGAYVFFGAHREVSDCDANINLLVSAIPADQPLELLESWENAFEKVKSQLAGPAPKAPAFESKPETWDFPFPQFKTVGDVRRCPADVYRSWYFDKTKNGEAFRNMVNSILDAENERRSQ